MGEGLMLFFFLFILVSLFVLGLHVGYALGLTTLILMVLGVGMGVHPEILVSQVFSGLNNFTILAIPFFLLVGRIMNKADLTSRIFNLAGQLVGNVRGGMCYVNVLASMIFAGMSGIGTADAAGLGPIEYKAMSDEGYPDEFILGIIGSSATIGPILPPSLPIVIYAITARVSAGRVLMAGFLPGILIGLTLMVMIYIINLRKDFPRGEKRTWLRFKKVLKEGLPALLAPVILIGGIMHGQFTVTEAAAMAVLYSVILGTIVYRTLSLSDLWDISRKSFIDSSAITLIVGLANAYGFLAIRSRLPMILAEKVMDLTTNPTAIIFLFIAVFLIVGLFLESIAAITLLTPIVIPIIQSVGIDPIYFGIIMVFTLMIGLLTPPFGLVLFVLSKSTGVGLNTTIKGVIPFYVPLFVALLIMVLFEPLVTWLPNLLF